MSLQTAIGPDIRVNGWIATALAVVATLFVFFDGIADMAIRDWTRGEYSHGAMIPIISLWLALLKEGELRRADPAGRWYGVGLIGIGLSAALVGELATLYTIIQYALIAVVTGLVVAAFGLAALRILAGPLVYLVFMIPLPEFFYYTLSAQLQLVSSEIGVALVRLFGVPVFLDGNIIDLGSYKLQVAEACSGLRYLFPMMSFGFLCAYIYKGPFWHRAVIFLATVPIAVLMNSARIGMVGLLVNVSGQEAAEGFMHYFEGWVIFLICLVVLFLIAALLMRLSRTGIAFADAFAMDLPPLKGPAMALRAAAVPRAFLTGLGLIALAGLVSTVIAQRAEIVPSRQSFAGFPLLVGDWHGREIGLSANVIGRIKVSDYFNADFESAAAAKPVNLYMAYYESQRKGASVHSPGSCIPGGGWEIERLETVILPDIGGASLPVKRLVIVKGTSRQLVYYWFAQRGRQLTNEYLVKWYILTDAMTRNRTDGALVRLVTPLSAEESMARAEDRLSSFARVVYPLLGAYLPE